MNLQTVTVRGEKPIIENKIDKKVFNVSESVLSSSGTATDILKQVPSVSVDADGNVTLRGSENVVILINGKPSVVSGNNMAAILQQLPANMIENIEVMTNPSSKYDPDGTAGIININLKKNTRMGNSGNVTFNAGTNNKYNGQASMNYNYGKLSISGSYSGRYDYRPAIASTTRDNWRLDSTQNKVADSDTNTSQYTQSKDYGYSHMGRLNLEYNVNEHTSVNLISSLLYRFNNDDDLTHNLEKSYQNMNPLQYITIDSSFQQYSQIGHGINADNNLNFDHKFNKPDEDLKVNITRSDSRTDQINNFNKLFILDTTVVNYRENQVSTDGLTSLQADYTYPVNDKIVFETGWKSNIEKIDNNYANDSLLGSNWVPSKSLTNHFIYNSQIHAGYGTWKQEMGSFGYQVGLRAEYFSRDFQLINTGENQEKVFYNLYPSLHIQQDINDNNQLVFSYSRRVNRPNPWLLNPFPRYQNSTTFTVGNPALNPEYINSYSFGHLLKFDRNTITTDIFYRKTLNQIAMTVETINASLLERKFENMNSSTSYGIDMTAIYYLTNWWTLNINGAFYNYIINTSNLDLGINSRQAIMYNAKIISTISFPGNFSFQLSGYYRSRMILIQGIMNPFYSLDAGIRKEVLKGKGTITLSAYDIFNTLHFVMNTTSPNFDQQISRKWDSQIVFLGFTYRFGSVVVQKQKPEKPEQNNQEDMNQMNNMY